ncbi:MAG TPA: metallophosphoesterase, partial [Chitinophagaceae bacterium]
LKLLVEKINFERQDEIYFLGDYIDRGAQSKEVVDFIGELKDNNYKIHTLRGNHEQLFMDSDKGFNDFENWIMNGGIATLESFQIARFGELDDEYKAFFNATKFYFETNDFIFVHAGLNFQVQALFEDTFSMLWIRNMKVDKKRVGDKVIIHGHTPTPLKVVKKNLALIHKTGALNIDTGCVMKDYHGYGYLSALEVGTMQLYSVENID